MRFLTLPGGTSINLTGILTVHPEESEPGRLHKVGVVSANGYTELYGPDAQALVEHVRGRTADEAWAKLLEEVELLRSIDQRIEHLVTRAEAGIPR